MPSNCFGCGRAVAFYRDVLGLSLAFVDEKHGCASFSAGPISLGMAASGEEDSPLLGVHTGIGFNTADLEAEHARLSKLGGGVQHAAFAPAMGGGFLALMDDPDGNVSYLDEIAAAHS